MKTENPGKGDSRAHHEASPQLRSSINSRCSFKNLLLVQDVGTRIVGEHV